MGRLRAILVGHVLGWRAALCRIGASDCIT
jgi:hypothetical protein